MPTFWILALVMGAVAAAFVCWPLLRDRDVRASSALRARSNLAIFEDRLAEIEADLAEQRIEAREFDSLKAELERSLLKDVDATELDVAPGAKETSRGRVAIIAGAALVPLLALVLYADWGASFGALGELQLAEDVQRLDAPRGADGRGAPDAGEMAEVAARLEARLAREPEDPDGWFLLGRTRLNLGDYEAAARAFGRVAGLTGGSIVPLVFQTQALYLAEDRRLTTRVRAVMDRVLAVEPEQPIMLELLAMDAFQSQRFAEAAGLFERVLRTDIQDPARREFLQDGVARARELAGMPAGVAGGGGPASGDAASRGPAAGGSASRDAASRGSASRGPASRGPDDAGMEIRVQVELAPELLTNLPDSARVFVLARAAGGPRMPLAVERVAPGRSIDVTLSAADAMSPAMTIDTVDAVEVVARLSMAGTAMPGEGDQESVAGPIDTGRSAAVRLFLGAGAPAPVVRTLEAQAAAPAVADGGRAASSPAPPPTPAPDVGDPADDASVRLLVEVDPALEVPAGATLFVFAREVDGPPMPVAVARLEASALPALVNLDDAMAMVPGRTLSSIVASGGALQAVARVSADGGVTPRSGDLEGVSTKLDPASSRVVPLLIDRRIP